MPNGATCVEHTHIVERLGIVETKTDNQEREIMKARTDFAEFAKGSRSEMKQVNRQLTKLIAIVGVISVLGMTGLAAMIRAFAANGLF